MKQFKLHALLAILFLGNSLGVIAKEGHEIKVKINGLSNDTLHLAYHLGDKQYMKDTIALDKNGQGVFKGNEPLPGGVYLVVFPKKNYFEIVVNEQEFSIENDTTDFINNFKSSGSVENKIFYDDLRLINKKQKEKRILQEKLKQAEGDKDETKKIKEELSALDEEVIGYRKALQEEHAGTFYSKFIKALEDPEIPEAPKDEKGNLIDSSFAYKYYKSHYFDNIDLADDRMLRTPILHKKVMAYMNRFTPQIPDSLSKSCDVILEEAIKDPETFQYWLVTLLNKYAKSKIMGMDAVYVHLVEKYYNSKKADWVSEDDLYRIADRAKSLKPTLLGKVAPNMRLSTPEKQLIPLHSVQSKYVMLYIYAPDCGHCKKETPKMLQSFKRLSDTLGIDIEVYAAPTMHLHKGEYDENKRPVFSDDPKDLAEWTDFIEKFKIQEWINVADLYLRDNFRETYDVNSTPKSYLLDKDKKILAKRFSADQFAEIVEDLEKRDKKKSEN